MNINKELCKALARSDNLLVELSQFCPLTEMDKIIIVRQDNVDILDKILYDERPTSLQIVAEWGIVTAGIVVILGLIGKILGVI